MKALFLLLSIFSFSAFSQINEFECERNYDVDSNIFIGIERPIFRNSNYRDINVSITQDDEEQTARYRNVWIQSSRLNRVVFSGAGMRLEIDTWQTNGRIIWGRRYPSTFTAVRLNDGRQISQISCTYYGTR